MLKLLAAAEKKQLSAQEAIAATDCPKAAPGRASGPHHLDRGVTHGEDDGALAVGGDLLEDVLGEEAAGAWGEGGRGGRGRGRSGREGKASASAALAARQRLRPPAPPSQLPVGPPTAGPLTRQAQHDCGLDLPHHLQQRRAFQLLLRPRERLDVRRQVGPGRGRGQGGGGRGSQRGGWIAQPPGLAGRESGGGPVACCTHLESRHALALGIIHRASVMRPAELSTQKLRWAASGDRPCAIMAGGGGGRKGQQEAATALRQVWATSEAPGRPVRGAAGNKRALGPTPPPPAAHRP
jgi:hypothetical protein